MTDPAQITPFLEPGAGELVTSAPPLPDLRIARSLALIVSPTGTGTGLLVGPRQILTAAHVVADHAIVTVAWGEIRVHAQVIAVDPTLDLAVLQVDAPPPWAVPVDWRRPPPVQIAQAVWVWGFPHAASLSAVGYDAAASVSAGVLSARRQLEGRHYLETDAAINPGESGGPLVAADGSVVGLIVSGLTVGGRDPEGLNFALDLRWHWDAIAALLGS